MQKTQALGRIFIIFAILFGPISCKPDERQVQPQMPPINIVVILDTSDRISREKNPEQVQKDIEIARSIVDLFEEFVQKKLYIGSNHTLGFVIPEQKNFPSIPQNIISDLKIWPTPQEKRGGAPVFEEKKVDLLTAIDKLYQFVGNQNKFTGSDIWIWFRDSAEVYLKKDSRNYIICLSDGYLDFNADIQAKRSKIKNKASYIPYSQIIQFRNTPNWQQKFRDEEHGLLETGKNFSDYDVKFLMVEIAYRDMFDLEIIKEYWRKWLESMGISDAEFLPGQDDPRIVKERIKSFIF